MLNFMLLSRCENLWPFLTLRALTSAGCDDTSSSSSLSILRTLNYQSNKSTDQINRQYMYLVKPSTIHVPVAASR